MDAQKFIQLVAGGEASQAKDMLNDLLSARAFESLDIKKQEIAQALYNNGEDIEVQDTADSEIEDEELLTQEEFDALSEEDKNLYMEMLDSVETQLREIGLLDEEQLDEISVTAAKNYLHKAVPSSSKLNQKSAKPGEKAAEKHNYSYENAPYEVKEFKKFSKRRTGIRRAINKLASAHPENKKHAKIARQAFNSIYSDNYRVGMNEPRMGQKVDKERENIRNAHKTIKTAVNNMHKNAMKKEEVEQLEK